MQGITVVKRTLVLLAFVLLLATTGTALADSAPAAPAAPEDGAAPLFLEDAPLLTPAASFAEGAEEPLFTGGAICIVPLPGATDCTLRSRCSLQAVCTETGTPVRVETCTCCIPCSGPDCPIKPECATVSYPAGCC